MTEPEYPILYRFRRCPYAMRARMALYQSGVRCTLREVVLRDKPQEMVALSAKATTPVLEVSPGNVVDESLDIMLWALARNDPDDWLSPQSDNLEAMLALINDCEANFKPHLDRYKYANRYDNSDPMTHRYLAETFLETLNLRLSNAANLFGQRSSLADFAIAPFIRQFANTDRHWFDAAPYSAVRTWLSAFTDSALFSAIMEKHTPWKPGDPPVRSAVAAP